LEDKNGLVVQGGRIGRRIRSFRLSVAVMKRSLEQQPWPARRIARPDEGYDVRQGDVVVSQPCETISSIRRHDLIKAKAW
jgi:hypothetical protein